MDRWRSKGLAMTLLALSVTLQSHAQRDTIEDSRRTAIVRSVERVAPAVVTVHVLDIQYERVVDPFIDDFFRSFSFFRPPTRIRERPVRAIGSGFVINREGYIITNYHVVENAKYVSVTLPDGRNLEVEFIGADERSDLAVLKGKGEDLPYVELGNSDDLLIGEWMIAIGNPFGLLVRDPQPSVSVGVVSATNRQVSHTVGRGERYYQDMIQTDAAINPGNSGGPLVNSLGQVVGVNTFIFSQSGGNIGLGFAIPINRAKRVVDEIIRHGRRLSTWPGFTAVLTQAGPTVYEIRTDSPAYRAGLRRGDVITGLNGEPVEHPTDINFAFWGMFVGDEATIAVDRQGAKLEFTFRIQELSR